MHCAVQSASGEADRGFFNWNHQLQFFFPEAKAAVQFTVLKLEDKEMAGRGRGKGESESLHMRPALLQSAVLPNLVHRGKYLLLCTTIASDIGWLVVQTRLWMQGIPLHCFASVWVDSVWSKAGNEKADCDTTH